MNEMAREPLTASTDPYRRPTGRHAAASPVPEVAAVAVGDPGRAATAVIPIPDPDFPFRHGTVLEAVRIEGPSGAARVDLRAASARGLSHQYYGTVRQDEFAFVVTGDRRWLVVSIADGVSAGRYSHLAAEIVSHSGCRRVAEHLRLRDPAALDWAEILTGIAGEVVDCAGRLLHRGQPDLAEVAAHMAATALFAIVDLEPAPSGDLSVQVMSLGDTSAWLLCPDSAVPWEALQEVKNVGSVVASSATAAIPLVPSELRRPVTAAVAPEGVLVLMSDGVGDPLGSGTGEVGVYLAERWRRPPDMLNFAAQVNFARRSYDDDRTVVAIWPVAAAP